MPISASRSASVRPVTRHRDDGAIGAKCLDDPQLLLGPNPREHAHRTHCIRKRFIRKRPQSVFRHNTIGVVTKADLTRDSTCRRGVIAGNHDDLDAGAATLFQTDADRWAHGVGKH